MASLSRAARHNSPQSYHNLVSESSRFYLHSCYMFGFHLSRGCSRLPRQMSNRQSNLSSLQKKDFPSERWAAAVSCSPHLCQLSRFLRYNTKNSNTAVANAIHPRRGTCFINEVDGHALKATGTVTSGAKLMSVQILQYDCLYPSCQRTLHKSIYVCM